MAAQLPPPVIPGGFLRPANLGMSLVPDGVTVQGRLTFSFGQCTSGTIAGSLLTTTGSNGAGSLSGQFAVGQTVYASGVSTGVTIASLGTGTGGAGTYNLSSAPSAVSGVPIASSTGVINLTNAAFVAGDVGKAIRVQGLGLNGADLITTIAAVNSATSITLAAQPQSAMPFGLSGGAAFVTVTYGTDNSVTLQAAHDAAVTRGHRNVYLDPGVYWAGNLTQGGQVIWVGQNASFVGTRRFRVQAPTRRTPYHTRPTLVPSVHLAKFQAQSSPRVAFVGDSIGTPDFIGNASIYLAQEIKRELRRSYPGKTISFFDYAIGGCQMSDFSSASEINFAGRALTQPYWWSAGHTWMYQIQNLPAWGAGVAPHTVFIELGTNQASGVATEAAALYSVITQLQALSTAPDIILLTPGLGSSQNPAWNGDTNPEKWEQIGTFWRGFAQRNGLGYIDIGRHARLLKEGIDVVVEDIPSNPVTGIIAPLSIPLALPMCRDFAINWSMSVSNAQWIATGTNLVLVLGDSLPKGFTTLFKIGRTAGGNFQITITQGGKGTVLGPIDTGVLVPTTGTIFFEFVVRDTFVHFATSNSTYGAVGLMPAIWEGEIERLRSPYTPVMYYDNNVSTTITVSQVCLSVEQQVMPTMIDADYFGTANPTVHPSSGGQVQLYRQALENERFV